MRKCLALVLLVGLVACAGALRHKLVVTSATSHVILVEAQETVKSLTCDVLPSFSRCIGPELRKKFAADFVKGFQLDEDIATAIRNWDGTTPQPAQIPQLVVDLTNVIQDILMLIPISPQKDKLEVKIGVK
jgi:hypothetical protein